MRCHLSGVGRYLEQTRRMSRLGVLAMNGPCQLQIMSQTTTTQERDQLGLERHERSGWRSSPARFQNAASTCRKSSHVVRTCMPAERSRNYLERSASGFDGDVVLLQITPDSR